MAPRKMKTGQHSTHKGSEVPIVVLAGNPIQVSTPPVRIIGTRRRHKGGFRLSDR
jgi:hypothetical protein